MKSFFLLLILIIFGNSLLSAQESDDRKKIFPINEFTFSLNRTAVADENTQDRFGFGIGLYYVFFNQKRCNLITGLEYNRNVQFKKTMYAGHYGNDYNVTYKIRLKIILRCYNFFLVSFLYKFPPPHLFQRT